LLSCIIRCSPCLISRRRCACARDAAPAWLACSSVPSFELTAASDKRADGGESALRSSAVASPHARAKAAGTRPAASPRHRPKTYAWTAPGCVARPTAIASVVSSCRSYVRGPWSKPLRPAAAPASPVCCLDPSTIISVEGAPTPCAGCCLCSPMKRSDRAHLSATASGTKSCPAAGRSEPRCSLYTDTPRSPRLNASSGAAPVESSGGPTERRARAAATTVVEEAPLVAASPTTGAAAATAAEEVPLVAASPPTLAAAATAVKDASWL